MEERIQVHHNYISTVSNHEHKKDLINRLKRSNPHNIPAYKAEMVCHMAMHDDVLGRILTILKQDDYYRMLEELPVIDNLRADDDIQLFPELYDTTTIIERVTGEADLIKRQLRQPGMYPLNKTPLPSTSGFVPKPTSTFQPIVPASPQPVKTQGTQNQNTEYTPKFTTLWTMDTYKLKQDYKHTILRYTPTTSYTSTTTTTYPHTLPTPHIT